MVEVKNNYRVAYNKFWQDIKKRDPEEITAARAVHYNSEKRELIVLFFNDEYLLDIDKETICRKADQLVPDMMDSIIILNYLSYAQPLQESAPRWVSLKEIPGGMIFYPAFKKNSLLPLIEAFGQQAGLLRTVASSLGGQPASIADSSIIIRAFPEIPLRVIVWEGDEEVSANATILYDPSIVPMLHSESIIGLGMSLSSKLYKLALKNDMDKFTKKKLDEALQIVSSTIRRCEKTQPKFVECNSQHTRLKNMIKAMYISKSLITDEVSKRG